MAHAVYGAYTYAVSEHNQEEESSMGMEYGCGCGNNVGGVNQGPPVVSPYYTSTNAILVLFILLVIITKACIF